MMKNTEFKNKSELNKPKAQSFRMHEEFTFDASGIEKSVSEIFENLYVSLMTRRLKITDSTDKSTDKRSA